MSRRVQRTSAYAVSQTPSEADPMTDDGRTYRLYRMNALTGAIRDFEDFSAYTDDEAIGRAIDEAGDYRIELWHGDRKVAAISGKNGPSELTIAPPTD
jgi:hypothetical protein